MKDKLIINSKVDVLNEDLFEYETEIVEIKTSDAITSELGPLKYLSGLTGIPMDRIINYLLLTIIFVFDPLAIALVIAANYAFERIRPNTKKNLYGEKVKIEEDAEDSIKEEIEESLWDKPESWDKSIIDEEESSNMYEHAYKSPIKEERGLPEGYSSEIGEN